MKVEFKRGGVPVEFSDCSITITKMPRDFHFSATEAPALAVL